MRLNKIILKTINEEFLKSLLSLDNEIKFSKLSLSKMADHTNKESVKYLTLLGCKKGDLVYKYDNDKFIISHDPLKKYEDFLYGYCCIEANETPDNMPRFVYIFSTSYMYEMCSKSSYMDGRYLNNIIHPGLVVYKHEAINDYNGWNNTEKWLICDCKAAQICKNTNKNLYIPSLGELVSFKDYINNEGIIHENRYNFGSVYFSSSWREYGQTYCLLLSKYGKHDIMCQDSLDKRLVAPFIHITTENLVTDYEK